VEGVTVEGKTDEGRTVDTSLGDSINKCWP